MGPCPKIARYYRVPASPSEAIDEMTQAFLRADFMIEQASPLDCARLLEIGDACYMYASQGSDEVQVDAWSEQDIELGFVEPGGSVVRILTNAAWSQRPPASPQPTLRPE